eukprot:gb/GECG01014044.1/.p1 GENE.gb/GECG01014044.1/~~gb/GECG01014044.1/.p1  ORF type:complete len:137 (+),score=17.77 gb/GECG01014044.1/:1-411(+)
MIVRKTVLVDQWWFEECRLDWLHSGVKFDGSSDLFGTAVLQYYGGTTMLSPPMMKQEDVIRTEICKLNGQGFRLAGNDDAALQAFESALVLDPLNQEAHLAKTDILSLWGKHQVDGAIECKPPHRQGRYAPQSKLL